MNTEIKTQNKSKSRAQKFLMPAVVFVSPLLMSFGASAMQYQGSVQRLIDSCNQELRTLCNQVRDPREGVLCLRENETRLQTQECAEEMRLLNRQYYNVPMPTEQPFVEDSTVR